MNILHQIKIFFKDLKSLSLNIVGISISIGCAFVIFLFIDFQFNVDKFHVNYKNIYSLINVSDKNGTKLAYSGIQQGLIEKMESSTIGIDEVVRLKKYNAIVESKKNESFYEEVLFADPSFFKVFSFPVKEGVSSQINEINKIVISNKIADKYFPNANPIGKNIKLSFNNNQYDFQIVCVTDKLPSKRSFSFDFIISYELLKRIDTKATDYNYLPDAVFIYVKSDKKIESISNFFTKNLNEFNEQSKENKIIDIAILPLKDLSLNSYKFKSNIIRGWGNPQGRIAFIFIGLFLIIIASINYINSAMANDALRLREIAIRKTLGASKLSIVTLFIVKHLKIVSFSAIIGFILGILILLPAFESFLKIGLEFEFSINNLLFLIFIIILITLFAGLYPAINISRFQAATIFRGGKLFSLKKPFISFIMFMQFLFAFLYIVASVLFILNEKNEKNKNPGYNSNDVLVINTSQTGSYNYLKNQLANIAEVESIASADEHIGFNSSDVNVSIKNNNINTKQYVVDKKYLSLLKINIKEGSLTNNVGTTKTEIAINEVLAKSLLLKNPIGEYITLNDSLYKISAVIGNVNLNDFQKKIDPVVFLVKNKEEYKNIIVKSKRNKSIELMGKIKEIWNKEFSEIPFDGYHQDSAFESSFNFISATSSIMFFSAFMALLLSCMGLYGLIQLNIIARNKEYVIMKVLGVNKIDLMKSVGKFYFIKIIVAILIGIPLSIFMSNFLFRIIYTNYVKPNILHTIPAILILLLVSFLTLYLLVNKLYRNNNIEILKNN